MYLYTLITLNIKFKNRHVFMHNKSEILYDNYHKIPLVIYDCYHILKVSPTIHL